MNGDHSEGRYAIFDNFGHLLQDGQFEIEKRIHFDAPPGIYLLKVTLGDRTLTKKLLKL